MNIVHGWQAGTLTPPRQAETTRKNGIKNCNRLTIMDEIETIYVEDDAFIFHQSPTLIIPRSPSIADKVKTIQQSIIKFPNMITFFNSRKKTVVEPLQTPQNQEKPFTTSLNKLQKTVGDVPLISPDQENDLFTQRHYSTIRPSPSKSGNNYIFIHTFILLLLFISLAIVLLS